MQKTVLMVGGMSCSHCVAAVENALSGIPGVKEYRVEIGKVEISYDPDAVDLAKVRAAIEDQGYTVSQ